MSMTAAQPSRPPRVALIPAATPTPLQRELHEFLRAEPGLTWLGAFDTDTGTIEAMRDSRPAVVVADLRVDAGLEVGQVFRAIFAASPSTQIVAICAIGDAASAGAALAAGAAACLTRHSDPLAVLRAIHEAMRGGMLLSPTGQRAMRGILDPVTGRIKPE